ncbi:MAG: UDP-N-acetylmuramate dehydrogenase [Deltaproteobacteria bacterium]|nr:UDP-N-acetylmuramate dehydrogenase [Deltaproteobacteria bacterium]
MGFITEEMKQELLQLCRQIHFDEPMSRHTSIRVGGKADALLYPSSLEEVTSLLAYLRQKKLPHFSLGAGSNLIVRDKGIRGVVLCMTQGFSGLRLEEPTILYVESGVGLPRLIEFAVEKGLSGVEALVGIPGNVGGALVMNAGTPDGDIGRSVLSVTFVGPDGKIMTWGGEKIRFAYRESHFPRGVILLSTRLKLVSSTPETVREKTEKLRAKRIETQPLNVPNLGSVFKNPQKAYAARLIEESGLKDVRVGGARISPKHANFIVNEGRATARDVLALVGLIKDKVKEKSGVSLELEAQVVGEE